MKPTVSLSRASLKRFCADERGGTAIEYALIASGVSIVIAATAFSIGDTLRDDYFGKVYKAFNKD